MNPGLVYEAFKQDYIKLLCGSGYANHKLKQISGDMSATCPNHSRKASPKDLNYPSMMAEVSSGKSYSVIFHRTVTNVGVSNFAYKEKIFMNPGMNIKVNPKVLYFKSLNEKKSFIVSVTGRDLPGKSMVSGSLVWSSSTHSVRSLIVIHKKQSHSSMYT